MHCVSEWEDSVSLRGTLACAEAWSADDGAIDLWLVSLGDVSAAGLATLAPDERERAAAQVRLGRGHFAAARVALRAVLARYSGVPPEALRFEYGEYGRPALAGPGPDFNLSHSGELALVVVAPGASVGVDIERVDEGRDLRGVARRFFAPAESASLEALQGRRLAESFFRLWVCKEAYLKGVGASIAVLSPGSFGLRFDLPEGCSRASGEDDVFPRLAFSEWPGGRPEDWHFRVLEAPDDYAAAVCWTGGARRLRVFRHDPHSAG